MSTAQVLNPATEEVIATLDLHDERSTDQAIARSLRAQRLWCAVSAADRSRLLRRFADVVDTHSEELAQLEVSNAGHTIGNARWEAGNVRDVLHYYSGAPERHLGQQIPVTGGMVTTFHEPIGVVGVIVPWNFPMPI
ncbi:MAG: aldehyde dehydrogenase family protein, partial [Ornithinimicrobium sp.]